MNAKTPAYDPNTLKIMIVSTPKTGNTWLKHLLAHIYELPAVDVGLEFQVAEVEALGARRVTHQHYPPRADLLDWAEQNDVVFVTTIRHPGDVLVSMFHFFRRHANRLALDDPAQILVRDGDEMGEHTAAFLMAEAGFVVHLNLSLAWMRSARPHVVRYEDLWRDPTTALQNLTAAIIEAPLDRIEYAVELCDIDLMRNTLSGGPEFFRKGSVGDWKSVLPPEIADILRHTEPYPTQFAELGYTLDQDDPLTTLPQKPRVSRNSLEDIGHFDNGVPVPQIAVKLYGLLDPTWRRRWLAVEQATTPDSFYAWLNAPADEDPCGPGALPVVTNLAEFISRTRPDIRALFPDVFGQDRSKFVAWYVQAAQAKYDLDEVFITPMQDALLAWAGLPAKEDPYRDQAAPTLTNLAIYVYRMRPDLQVAFPDVFAQDRHYYAHWFLSHAQDEYVLAPMFVEILRDSERIISQSLPERGNIVRSLLFSLRRKLFWLLKNWGSKREWTN